MCLNVIPFSFQSASLTGELNKPSSSKGSTTARMLVTPSSLIASRWPLFLSGSAPKKILCDSSFDHH